VPLSTRGHWDVKHDHSDIPGTYYHIAVIVFRSLVPYFAKSWNS
jgi:hypothetical protein